MTLSAGDRRLLEEAARADFEAEQTPPRTLKYVVVTEPHALAHDLATRPRDEPVTLDCETTGLHMYEGDRVLCGSLWFGDEAYVFPAEHAAEIVDACYHGLTVFHNANFDRAMIEQTFGLTIDDRLVVDTLTIDWCLRESWPHALKEIAARLWGHDEKSEKIKLDRILAGMTVEEAYKARRAEVGRSEPAAQSKEWARAVAAAHPKRTYADLTMEEWAPYAAKDAELTWRLLRHHDEELDKLADTPWDVRPALVREHRVDAFCLRLQRTGIRVNQDRAHAFQSEAQRTADEIAAEEVFEGVNLRSDRQVAELVYDRWEHPCERFTETGARSVDKAALSLLAWDPRVARLSEFKKAANALSKFYNPILEHTAADGRIHASFRSHGTETGRFSSSGPNLQQLPRTSTNRRVRPLFVPEPGLELVEFDLEQAELRIGAAVAGERSIVEALEGSVDLYQSLADDVGVTRQQAKMIALSAQYGIGARKLAAQLAFGTGRRPDPRAARAVLDGYWRRYPNLKRAIDDHARLWEAQGYLAIGWPGRIRHLEGPFGPEPTYAGFNSVVQGGQAEFLKDVLLDLEEAMSAIGRIVLTVHDSVVLEIEPGRGDKVAGLLEDISGDRNRWGVPLRWAKKEWRPAPCWLAAPGAPSWLCALEFGHRGECDHVPVPEA
jgi:DNA polymerase I-like protein with 3'-5' exonuclease and polymerase domains